jgi:hypothetical protein
LLNRAGKAWKPRETALSQLGDDSPSGVPFVFWIDWNSGERNGQRCLLSSGMETLGLPDVAVVLADDSDPARDRARAGLLYACQQLSMGKLSPRQIAEQPDATLAVPRQLELRPGSQLRIADPEPTDRYQMRATDEAWVDLTPAG